MIDDSNTTTQKEMGMPWQPKDFSKKNKKLSGHKLTVAAAAANSALKSGNYSEGQAIAIGNAAGNKASTKGSTGSSTGGSTKKMKPNNPGGPGGADPGGGY